MVNIHSLMNIKRKGQWLIITAFHHLKKSLLLCLAYIKKNKKPNKQTKNHRNLNNTFTRICNPLKPFFKALNKELTNSKIKKTHQTWKNWKDTWVGQFNIKIFYYQWKEFVNDKYKIQPSPKIHETNDWLMN